MEKRFITFMVAVFCLGIMPISAQQNLITNGDFEAGSANFETNYSQIVGPYGVLAGYYCIDNTTSQHGIGSLGWPTLENSSGKFMMVNGFGGSENPTKVVWRQTVTVTPQTTYAISYRFANLNRMYFGQIYPAKLQMKINGSNVGEVNSLPTNNNWQSWADVWPSGTATQAVIEIYDTFEGDTDYGDDYALDDFSFIAQATYSVNAVDDDASVCLYQTVQIDVLDNDIILPSSQSQGATVTITQSPTHGQASVNQNTRKIQYTFFDGSFAGNVEQIKYRVTIPHGEYAEAWVNISTSTTPNVGWIDPPQGPICASGPLGIAVPSVTPITLGHWEHSTTQDGTYSTFDATSVPLSMNNHWVRYAASNDCGDGTSNSVQITVTNGPSFTGQTPQIQPICAGTSLNLTAPAFNTNGSPIVGQGWVAASTQNGEYTSISLNNINASYNGWYIRYMVESSCGVIYSNPPRQLVVNVAPDVTGTLQAPSAICAGYDLELTVPSYEGSGTGSWEISQTPNGTYQSFSPENVPSTYNNWYLRYKVSNDCGSDVSNSVPIHINDAPTIATPATPQAICAGGSFTLTVPSIQNNGSAITNQGWQFSATQNGTYNTFSNNNVPYTYNGYWIRYFAENECGVTSSVAVQITVNDEPSVGNIVAPPAICAGESFSLTTPTVQNHGSTITNQGWEIAPTSSGEFTTLNNNNIPFSYNGYYIRYKAVNGCGIGYSTNVVQVTVYSTEPTYDTITACDTYIWNGVTCDQSDDYQTQVESPNGCTIMAHLHFILSDAYTATQAVSECDSYFWHGHNYTNSGQYGDTIYSGDPLICDSIFTLNLTINHGPEILENLVAPQSACVGNALNVTVPNYEMNHSNGDAHWEYAPSASGPFTAFDPSSNSLSYGTYYLRYAVINECDEAFSNVVVFHINDSPVANMQLSPIQVCDGELLTLPEVNVNWRNDDENDRYPEWQISPTEDGTFATIDPTTMPMQLSHNGYWLRFRARNTCGNDIVGPVMITVISTEDVWLDTITTCDSYTLPSGEVITENYTIEELVLDPCPHWVYQHIEINYSDFKIEPITSCHDEFVWHGMTFYRSDEIQYAAVTLTNVHDCDSVVQLQLEFGDYAKITEQRTACDFYEWPRKPGSYYTESQIDSVFKEGNEIICDSMIYLNLTLGQTYDLVGDPMTECSGFEWNGVAYYDDDTIYEFLQTAGTHCDSIISHRLTIIQPIETMETIESCMEIMWYGQYCDTTDYYEHTFQSQQGCDSIVTLHFILTEQIFHEFDTLACEQFEWYGFQCNHNGVFEHQFETQQGCDSLVKMHVFLNQSVVETQFITACDHYEFEGVVYDQTGITFIPLDTLFGQEGCDSIVRRIRLEILESDNIGMISGSSSVYVSSNIISGIYRYEIDTAGVISAVTWSLTNPDWQVVESGDNYCLIYVPTPGSSQLKANFRTSDCGEMERIFEINAGYFGVDEYQAHVQIFPNPTKGTVTIEAEGIETIRVVNMMGQVLEMRECGRSNQFVMSLAGYVPSVYLFEINTVNGMVKRRVVLCK